MARFSPEPDPARGWWARGSLLLLTAAAVVLLAFAGGHSVVLILVTAAGLGVTLAALYWFLAVRGVLRWIALTLAAAVPLALVLVLVLSRLVWVTLAAGLLVALAVAAARAALRPESSEVALTTSDVPPPDHPWLLMNPRSGGGKVTRFALKQKAEALGAEVELMDPEGSDVRELALAAAARGADLLGVAGGDGTQALVAQVAAERDLPFLVISAGTRNHFALDLGLDREDPSHCLDALRDGVEARIDLGVVNGRTFVNNASFGAYAEVVENPAYRDDKRGTTLDVLPDLLNGARGAHLQAHAAGREIDDPQAVLVSNDPYGASDLAGMGRRPRLDRGVLGVISVQVSGARQAVRLLNRAHNRGLTRLEAAEVVITSDQPTVPAGVDGESLRLQTPVRCTSSPGALRVRLPRDRPGVPAPRGELAWEPLWSLAVHGTRTDGQLSPPSI